MVRWLEPKGGGADTPGKVGTMAYLEERRVLKLGDRFGLAREDEVADWNAASVEPHHEWRHRSRGHEGPGAVDVADRLRRGLRHVGAGMELELDQPDALDRLLSTCSMPVMLEEMYS